MKLYFILILTFQVLIKIQGQQCWIEGTCEEGFVLGASVVTSQELCLQYCQEDPECLWFTFFVSTSICAKFSECGSISTSSCDNAQDCISGQSNCKIEYECWLSGRCQGTFVGTQTSPSPEDCLNACKEQDECNWFSYDKEHGDVCLLLNDCSTFDETCSTCLSGQKECTFRGLKFIVATGYNFDKDDLNNVEVVHLILNKNETTSVCKNLPPYPVFSRGAFGAVVGQDQVPTICGGYLQEACTTDCYQLKDLNMGWEKIDSMKEARGFSGSTLFKGGLWVTGGYNRINSSEILSGSDFTWGPGPEMPNGWGMDRHCLLTINETTALIIGGDTDDELYSPLTWFYHLEMDSWTQGPELSIGRYGHACGILRDESGSPEKVVVASGYGLSGLLSETEILDLETETWSLGPPVIGYAAGMLEDGEGGVLFIGGRLDSFDRLDTIYQFKSGFPEWKLLDQKLKTHREYPVLMTIPDHLTSCTK